jgi:PAS domain S-box-containing protein
LAIKRDLGIPVIFMTAWADEQYLDRAKQADPFGYLVKPLNMDEVRATIEMALYRKAVERENISGQEQFRIIMDCLDDGITTVHEDGTLHFLNAAAGRMLDIDPATAQGIPARDLFHDALNRKLDQMFAHLRESGNLPPMTMELHPVDTSERKRLVEVTYVPSQTNGSSRVIVIMRYVHPDIVGNHRYAAILPYCSNCRRIRDLAGVWRDTETYLRTYFHIAFTHGICPECIVQLYPDLE